MLRDSVRPGAAGRIGRPRYAVPAAASVVRTRIRKGDAAALASLADPASRPCAARAFRPTPRAAPHLHLRANREGSGDHESTWRIGQASFLEDSGVVGDTACAPG